MRIFGKLYYFPVYHKRIVYKKRIIKRFGTGLAVTFPFVPRGNIGNSVFYPYSRMTFGSYCGIFAFSVCEGRKLSRFRLGNGSIAYFSVFIVDCQVDADGWSAPRHVQRTPASAGSAAAGGACRRMSSTRYHPFECPLVSPIRSSLCGGEEAKEGRNPVVIRIFAFPVMSP